jgi:hypothetical protein
MTVDLAPLDTLNRAAHAALVRELGVAGALRFMQQFSTGRGDYTAERHQWLESVSFADLSGEFEQIEAQRQAK